MFSVVLGLLVGEFAVRVSVPESLWRFQDATADWQLDSRLGWVQRPNLDITTRQEGGGIVRFRTNSDGVCPWFAQRARKPDRARVMIFGDSTVVGRAVPEEQTLMVHMERLLGSKGVMAEVICAGVQGYSTDQSLICIRQLVPLYRPDVVIFCSCLNDFGGNDVSVAYGQPKPRFVIEGVSGLREIPPDIRGKSITRFHSYGSLGWARDLIQYSALYRILQPHILQFKLMFCGWEERNLAGDESELLKGSNAEHLNWRLFSLLIAAMDQEARRNGALFFFFGHPSIEEVWIPYFKSSEVADVKLGEDADRFGTDRFGIERRYEREAKRLGVRFCPLIRHFLQNQNRGPFHLLPRDPHCNGRGYEVTAEVLIEYMVREHLIPAKTCAPTVPDLRYRVSSQGDGEATQLWAVDGIAPPS